MIGLGGSDITSSARMLSRTYALNSGSLGDRTATVTGPWRSDRGERSAAACEILHRMFSRSLLIFLPALLFAQANSDWDQPFPPHRVVGNIYYVGTKGLASY